MVSLRSITRAAGTYCTIRVRPTLDNDLHDRGHVDNNLDNGTYNDRNSDLLIARGEAGQQEPHHSSTRHHGQAHGNGLRHKIPFRGMESFSGIQVEEMTAQAPVGTRGS